MENFNKYCKDFIVDNIDDYKNTKHYGSDLAYIISESANVDGTLTYDAEKAKQYIKEWWDDAASYWQYEIENFGESVHNPFDNPEAYMVCMVIVGVDVILSSCPVLEKHWNEPFEIDGFVIEEIKNYVESYDEGVALF